MRATAPRRVLPHRRTAAGVTLGLALACAGTGIGAQAAAAAEITGPVVASWQHVNGAPIDWPQVAASGASFAVVQATDGADYRNPWFATDYNGARSAGLVRGSYAVGRPALPVVATAQGQADRYIARLGSSAKTTGTLAPVLDLQTTGGLTRAAVVQWAQTYLLRLHARTGRVPILHTNTTFASTGLGDAAAFARYPLWVDGGSSPAASWSLWGYASSARISGIVPAAPKARVTADTSKWPALHGREPAPWTTGAPGAPQQVHAAAFNGAAIVSWLPGDTGSSDVTGYTVTATPVVAPAPPTPTQTPTESPTPTDSASPTPTVTPSDTASPTPTASTTPTDSASPSPTDSPTPTPSSTPPPPPPPPSPVVANVSGSTMQTVVGGLANGTGYTFTVTATNAVGTGDASPPAGPVTPSSTAGTAHLPPPPRPAASVYTFSCPGPESVVRGTRWDSAIMGPGVTLYEGNHRDRTGIVRMHVLRVDVRNPQLRLAPLVGGVSNRRALTVFARGQSKLIAATNAGYFDLNSGAPLSPVIVNGQPLLGPSLISPVIGLGPDGLLQSAAVAAVGSITGALSPQPLTGWNAAQVPEGVSAYSSRWGSHRVPLPRGAVSRYLNNGVVSSGVGTRATAPHSGYLLAASGPVAVAWLRSLHVGQHVQVHVAVESTSRTPLSLAYAVGSHLVNNGVAGTGFSCKIGEKTPARTAIGWASDRRHLIIAVVDGHKPRTKWHGVDSTQLARIMHDLGANQAWLLDGGGSTEMIARHPHQKIKVRNYPTDGRERLLPLGFGIFRR